MYIYIYVYQLKGANSQPTSPFHPFSLEVSDSSASPSCIQQNLVEGSDQMISIALDGTPLKL